jgi:hypothetical protein
LKFSILDSPGVESSRICAQTGSSDVQSMFPSQFVDCDYDEKQCASADK